MAAGFTQVAFANATAWGTESGSSEEIAGRFRFGFKKPNTLRYDRAAPEHRLSPADSFVSGDSPDDVRAPGRLGPRGCLVRTLALSKRPGRKPPSSSVHSERLSFGSCVSHNRRRSVYRPTGAQFAIPGMLIQTACAALRCESCGLPIRAAYQRI